MLFLLDTNAVSDAMKEHPRIKARLAALDPADGAITCTVVVGEILFGIERLPAGKRREELHEKALRVLALLPCEPVAEAAAGHYSAVKRVCRPQSGALDDNDLWIAATALALGATLVTRDDDFGLVPGLSVEDWTV